MKDICYMKYITQNQSIGFSFTYKHQNNYLTEDEQWTLETSHCEEGTWGMVTMVHGIYLHRKIILMSVAQKNEYGWQ